MVQAQEIHKVLVHLSLNDTLYFTSKYEPNTNKGASWGMCFSVDIDPLFRGVYGVEKEP